MNKATLIYDFKNTDQNTINIGDYFQSIAALNIVGENYKDLFKVNRENFSMGVVDKNSNLKDVKLIANGWYSHTNSGFPIHENIKPLFISVHINDKLKFNEDVVKTFKKFEPIGCRDLDSIDKLESRGIKAYFSGCLTLSMQKRENDRNGIVFILDNLWVGKKRVKSFKTFKKWYGFDIIVAELMKNYSYEEIKKAKFYDQFSKMNLSYNKQFEIAEERLDNLAKASLVVTTRIHSLMPSMAMGTPSIYIMKDNNDDRFKGLMEFWNYIDFTNFSKKSKTNIKILRDKNKKIINNEDFRKFIEPSVKKVKKYWGE